MNLCLFLSCLIVLFCTSCMSSDSSDPICAIAECINSGNGDPSSAILCNDCMAKILSHDDMMNFYEYQRKLVISYSSRRKELPHLKADILFLIFDQLELIHMLNLLEGYPSKLLSIAAREYFGRKYKNYQIYVSLPYSGNNDGILHQKNSKEILLGRRGPSFFRLFGGILQDIKVGIQPPYIKDINVYASKSVIKLEINTLASPFEQFKKPFEKLEEFSLGCNTNITTQHLPFNQLLPSVRKMKIRSRDIDESFFGLLYPHLEHLEINAVSLRKNESVSEKFSNNLQMQHFDIKIYELTQETCEVLNDQVSNLENLTISKISNEVQNNTQFANVKHFTVNRNLYNFDRLYFPRLELFDIYDAAVFPAEWNDFVGKHQHLTRLKTQYTNIRLHGIQTMNQLSNGFLNLEEITVEGSFLIRADFEEIIDRNLNLRKLHLISCNPSMDDINGARETFGNTWNITEKTDLIGITEVLFEKLD